MTSEDIIGPDEDIMDRLDVLQLPLRATILRLEGGEFAFKIDLDGGVEKRDYEALARRFAAALKHVVVMPDERAPDPISSIRIRHGAPDAAGWIEDAGPEGHVNDSPEKHVSLTVVCIGLRAGAEPAYRHC